MLCYALCYDVCTILFHALLCFALLYCTVPQAASQSVANACGEKTVDNLISMGYLLVNNNKLMEACELFSTLLQVGIVQSVCQSVCQSVSLSVSQSIIWSSALASLSLLVHIYCHVRCDHILLPS
jgi:hypothetical protein